MDNNRDHALGFKMENLPPGTIVFQVPHNSGQGGSHPQGIPRVQKQQHLPQYPMDPRYPGNPMNLQSLVFPQNPVIPQNPVYPQNPAIPQNPVYPQNPAIPQNPVYPQNPAIPQNPVIPQNPAIPQNPVILQNHVYPQNPLSPQNLVSPKNPVYLQNPVNTQHPENLQNPVLQPNVAQQLSEIQELPTDSPGLMMCPHCQRVVLTKIKHRIGWLVWLLFAFLVIVFLCLFPLSLIPFFVKTCKNVEHSCPYCDRVLHTHKRA